MSWIPGWATVAGSGWWASFYFWASMGSLLLLGMSEIVSHRYSERKDELAEKEQTETKHQHDEEIARLHLETAQANEKAAEARLALEKYKAPRLLNDDEARPIIDRIKSFAGQTFVITTYWDSKEPRAFADRLLNVLNAAGWKYIPPERATMMFGGIEGVMVWAHKEAEPSTLQARDALVSALAKAGIAAVAKEFSIGAAPTNKIELTVGVKPQAN